LAALLVLAFVSTSAKATPKPFSIDAEEAPRSLLEFGRQSAVQILFASEKVRGVVTNAVHGNYEPVDALRLLLKGTPLMVSEKADGVLVVEPKNEGHPVSELAPVAADDAENASRLAQARAVSPPGSDIPQHANTGPAIPRDPNNPNLEEIVVTAQKREERLIDVPISMVVLGAEELRRREISSLDDLAFDVPGLAIQEDGETTRITLRGVSNLFGTSSLIGMYVDEADVTSASSAQLNLNAYDLERVEVLRGPQGTLYGEGSAGGTIRFITKNPNLNAFGMDADVASLFTEHGAPSQRINMMLNAPVVPGELGMRIAGTFDHEGGWIDQPAAGRKNINGEDLADVRVKALWQPFQELSVSAMAEIHRNNAGFPGGEDANGNFTQLFNLTTTPTVVDNFDIYNLTLTYELPAVRILNTTSYVKQGREASATNAVEPLDPSGIPTIGVYVDALDINVNSLTDELRLSSVGSGPWRWTAGGFYRHFELDSAETAYIGLVPGPLPAASLSLDSTTKSNSRAAFGDTSYDLTNRFTLGAGLRYFEDNQEFTSGPAQSGTFHSLDPRAHAQYKLTDQMNLYTSAAKGFRSGGFNSQNQPSFGPESVWTYELGTKMSLLSNRLSIDTALFYSDYTNYQINGLNLPAGQTVPITSNSGSAKIKGVEWGLTWRPGDGWSLSFNGDYIDSYFYKINATSTDHVVGDPLDLFPKYEYGLSAQRDFNWNGLPTFARLDYSQQGRETYRLRSIGAWYLGESDVIHLLNYSSEVECNAHLSLGILVKNLLNNRGFTDPFSIEGDAARTPPRTLGIQFRAKFD
jgi:iron complex outermembrane receptor protein